MEDLRRFNRGDESLKNGQHTGLESTDACSAAGLPTRKPTGLPGRVRGSVRTAAKVHGNGNPQE